MIKHFNVIKSMEQFASERKSCLIERKKNVFVLIPILNKCVIVNFSIALKYLILMIKTYLFTTKKYLY